MAPFFQKDGVLNPSGQIEKINIVGIAEKTMRTGFVPVTYQYY